MPVLPINEPEDPLPPRKAEPLVLPIGLAVIVAVVILILAYR